MMDLRWTFEKYGEFCVSHYLTTRVNLVVSIMIVGSVIGNSMKFHFTINGSSFHWMCDKFPSHDRWTTAEKYVKI